MKRIVSWLFTATVLRLCGCGPGEAPTLLPEANVVISTGSLGFLNLCCYVESLG